MHIHLFLNFHLWTIPESVYSSRSAIKTLLLKRLRIIFLVFFLSEKSWFWSKTPEAKICEFPQVDNAFFEHIAKNYVEMSQNPKLYACKNLDSSHAPMTHSTKSSNYDPYDLQTGFVSEFLINNVSFYLFSRRIRDTQKRLKSQYILLQTSSAAALSFIDNRLNCARYLTHHCIAGISRHLY